MAKWNYKLELKDVFHDDSMTFEQRRNEIVARIKKMPIPHDPHLEDLVCLLEDSEDPKDFDYNWDDFYDWCDRERVWVNTF